MFSLMSFAKSIMSVTLNAVVEKLTRRCDFGPTEPRMIRSKNGLYGSLIWQRHAALKTGDLIRVYLSESELSLH
jgi:hypothetical protein